MKWTRAFAVDSLVNGLLWKVCALRSRSCVDHPYSLFLSTRIHFANFTPLVPTLPWTMKDNGWRSVKGKSPGYFFFLNVQHLQQELQLLTPSPSATQPRPSDSLRHVRFSPTSPSLWALAAPSPASVPSFPRVLTACCCHSLWVFSPAPVWGFFLSPV